MNAKQLTEVVTGMQAEQSKNNEVINNMASMLQMMAEGQAHLAEPDAIPAPQTTQPAFIPNANPAPAPKAKKAAKHPDEYPEVTKAWIHQRPDGSRYLQTVTELGEAKPVANGKPKTNIVDVKGCAKSTLKGCFVQLKVTRNNECFNDAEVIIDPS